METTIRELDIAEALRGVVPATSKLSLVSLETADTTDHPVVAMVEDALVSALREGEFIILERDVEMLRRLASEGPDGTYRFVFMPRDRLFSSSGGAAAGLPSGPLPDVKPERLFRMAGVHTERESGGDRDSVLVFPTELMAADYLLSYRVLECGIVYRKGTSADRKKREGKARLHLRVLNTKTGEVLYAHNIDAVVTDEIDAGLKDELADFHYTFFPADYPISRGVRSSAREIQGKSDLDMKTALGVIGGLVAAAALLMLIPRGE